MLDYASLFDPRSENDDDAFTLTRPDRRWDSLRADWKEGINRLRKNPAFERRSRLGRLP
ncbi:MAG: hypothetical protein HZC25_10340 [Rhodospirillales bacterium]|nr:hypothetical protein [Rhodospirillales bacterium]